MKKLSLSLLWSGVLFAFIGGPEVYSVSGISIRLFDIACVLSFYSAVLYLLNVKKHLRISRYAVLGLIYPVCLVVSSLIGGLIYSYELGYFMGDARYIQSLLLISIIYIIYYDVGLMLSDFRYVVYLTVFVSLSFSILQVVHNFGLVGGQMLEWWFSGRTVASSRPLGYTPGRYGGPYGSPSRLGLVSVICMIYSILFIEGKYTRITVVLACLVMLGLSAHRTSMVGIVVILVVYIITNRNWSSTHVVSLSALVSFPLIIYILSINNFIEGGRVIKLIDIALGDKSYHDVAGRWTHWKSAIRFWYNNYLWGTLSNPGPIATARPEISVIDSEWIKSIIRFGIFGPILLLITFLSPLIAYGKGHRNNNVFFAMLIMFFLATASINQTALSNTIGQVSLLLGVVSLN
ncbi:O-antigen ligase family protein [Salinibacter ruber]|uniref:O-antigen ligase family protein n=1 Tax=Salinibacter ruber TaxID=146919 RepID=UPI002450095C|nr:putative integral membrane protein [Salinibacter ruber]